MTGIDWDAAQRAQNRVQNRFVIILLVDDVTNGAGAGELEDESIDPTDMIRHKKEAAGRQIFQAKRCDSIKCTHQWPAKKIKRAFSGGHPASHLIMSF